MLIAGALSVATETRAADWPEFMGPTHDQVSTETGLIDAFPPQGPRLLWERQLGKGYGAPSVRGDVLVVHHRVDDEEILEACSASTGATLWKYAYPSSYRDPFGYNNGPRCTPLLTADRCYAMGAEGILSCCEFSTGRLIWKRDTGRDFNVPEAFFGAGSSPVLEDGLLFMQIGGQPNAAVVAFDALTGKTVWQNGGEQTWNGVPMTGWPGERIVSWNPNDPAYEKQASYCTPVLATIHGKRHLLVCTRQGLISFDPKTGASNFAFWFRARQDSSVNAMTPVVQGDLILLSSAYFKSGAVVLRVNADLDSRPAASRSAGSGVTEVWRGLQLEIHWTRPVLYEGHLFAFSGRNEPDARFRCVDFATGKLRWDRDEGWPNGGHAKLSEGEKPPAVFGRGSAILADGKIIALGEAGLLGLFKPNAERLEELSRWQTPQLRYPCWAAPVLSAKRLYLRDEDRLVCYDLAR